MRQYNLSKEIRSYGEHNGKLSKLSEKSQKDCAEYLFAKAFFVLQYSH